MLTGVGAKMVSLKTPTTATLAPGGKKVAVALATPCSKPVTSPLASMVKMFVLVEAQVTRWVKSIVEPSLNSPVALSASV